MEQLIRKSGSRLRLKPKTIQEAIDIYHKSTKHPIFDDSRIRQESIAVASLYIANRLHHQPPYDQNIFVYKFNISFATLRKCYIMICKILNIPRDQIVSPHHL